MTPKLVMVLCDGLGDAPAAARMGFLEHLVEEKAATRFTSRCVLPSMSRPNYESLHTGLAPLDHGVLSNTTVRPSNQPNVFASARAAGLVTAAVAASFFSELYHEVPYDPLRHIEYDDAGGDITHGRFYTSLEQPDAETVHRGVAVAERFSPAYLLVHPMHVDHAGHEAGRDSDHYNQAVTHLDELLAAAIPRWLDMGYSVWVTSDHGHDGHKHHGGTEIEVRNVPLYTVRNGGPGYGRSDVELSHLQIAPTLCAALGIEIPPTMKAAPFEW